MTLNRRRALPLLAMAAIVAGTGCGAGERAGRVGPTPPRPSAAAAAALPPPGSLASVRPEPPAFGTVTAQASFRAVTVSARGPAGWLVVYPQVQASVAHDRAQLHVKLPYFTCTDRVPGAGDFHHCGGRRVEYADLVGAAPGILAATPDGGMSGAVSLDTYAYPGGVDASPAGAASYTGRRVTFALELHPVHGASGVRRSAYGTARLDGGSATIDEGYIARVLVRP